jgi:hypothetical protein
MSGKQELPDDVLIDLVIESSGEVGEEGAEGTQVVRSSQVKGYKKHCESSRKPYQFLTNRI